MVSLMSTSVLFVSDSVTRVRRRGLLAKISKNGHFCYFCKSSYFSNIILVKNQLMGEHQLLSRLSMQAPTMCSQLALDKCNATLAVSHTLTTDVQGRNCSAVSVPHSTVRYSSGSSVGHGTTAVLTCNAKMLKCSQDKI